LATPFRTVKGLIWAQIHRRPPAPPRLTALHKTVFRISGRFFPANEKKHAAPQQGNKTWVCEERRLSARQMGGPRGGNKSGHRENNERADRATGRPSERLRPLKPDEEARREEWCLGPESNQRHADFQPAVSASLGRHLDFSGKENNPRRTRLCGGIGKRPRPRIEFADA